MAQVKPLTIEEILTLPEGTVLYSSVEGEDTLYEDKITYSASANPTKLTDDVGHNILLQTQALSKNAGDMTFIEGEDTTLRYSFREAFTSAKDLENHLRATVPNEHFRALYHNENVELEADPVAVAVQELVEIYGKEAVLAQLNKTGA